MQITENRANWTPIEEIERRQDEVLRELDQLIERLDTVLRAYNENPVSVVKKAA